MREKISQVIWSAIGVCVGCLVCSRGIAVPSAADQVTAREFLVLGENGRTVARLGPRNGGAVLEFLDQAQQSVVEVGFEMPNRVRFVRLLAGGVPVAALNSFDPAGEATLSLGDSERPERITLGAVRSDVPAATVEAWGLLLRPPGAVHPAVSLLASPNGPFGRWVAGLRIQRADGRVWDPIK